MQKVGTPWAILTQPMRYGHQLSNECRLDEVYISHGSGENSCKKMYIKSIIGESLSLNRHLPHFCEKLRFSIFDCETFFEIDTTSLQDHFFNH